MSERTEVLLLAALIIIDAAAGTWVLIDIWRNVVKRAQNRARK